MARSGSVPWTRTGSRSKCWVAGDYAAPEALEFGQSIREKGVRGAVDARDAQFDDS